MLRALVTLCLLAFLSGCSSHASRDLAAVVVCITHTKECN